MNLLWRTNGANVMDESSERLKVRSLKESRCWHSQEGWAWLRLQVRGRAMQSGVSTETWAGLSGGTAAGWSSSPVGWGLSPAAVGVLKGSSDCGGASQDSQSPRTAARVFWCVFQLCLNPGPSAWRPLCQPQPRQDSCGSTGEQPISSGAQWLRNARMDRCGRDTDVH